MTDLINPSVNDKAVCRTAPATPGQYIKQIYFSRIIETPVKIFQN